MRRSFVRQARRAALVVAAAVAGVVLIAGEALGAHTVFHSGVTGPFSFTDTSTTPGARCNYEGAAGHGFFSGMKVKAPIVFWPNRHPGNTNEHGTVGWRIKIQQWTGSHWMTVDTGVETTAVAHESTAAPFVAKTLHHDPPNARKYRAQVVLTWHGSGSTTLGRAKVVLDWYNQTDPGVIKQSCKAVVCHVCMTPADGSRAADAARRSAVAVPQRRD